MENEDSQDYTITELNLEEEENESSSSNSSIGLEIEEEGEEKEADSVNPDGEENSVFPDSNTGEGPSSGEGGSMTYGSSPDCPASPDDNSDQHQISGPSGQEVVSPDSDLNDPQDSEGPKPSLNTGEPEASADVEEDQEGGVVDAPPTGEDFVSQSADVESVSPDNSNESGELEETGDEVANSELPAAKSSASQSSHVDSTGGEEDGAVVSHSSCAKEQENLGSRDTKQQGSSGKVTKNLEAPSVATRSRSENVASRLGSKSKTKHSSTAEVSSTDPFEDTRIVLNTSGSTLGAALSKRSLSTSSSKHRRDEETEQDEGECDPDGEMEDGVDSAMPEPISDEEDEFVSSSLENGGGDAENVMGKGEITVDGEKTVQNFTVRRIGAQTNLNDEHVELDYDEDEGEDSQTGKEGDEEEGEEKEEGEKTDKDDGELDDDDDCEEGEIKEPGSRKPFVKPICRFYTKGNCTWGNSCRFLHPGINDKGNYRLIDMPYNGMGMQRNWSGNFSGPRWTAEATVEAEPLPPPLPPAESAWERGLRHAKEQMKKATMRKEREPNFEEKRMNLSLEEEREFNKENERNKLFKDPYFDPQDEDDFYNRSPVWQGGAPPPPPPPPPQFENLEIRYNREPDYPPYRVLVQEKEREQRFKERHYSPVMERPYSRPMREERREKFRPVERGSPVQMLPRGRADEWHDPWRRSKSPKLKRRANSSSRSRSRGRRRFRRSFSHSSFSSRSRSSSLSSRSSFSSFSSRTSSFSRSRSRSPGEMRFPGPGPFGMGERPERMGRGEPRFQHRGQHMRRGGFGRMGHFGQRPPPEDMGRRMRYGRDRMDRFDRPDYGRTQERFEGVDQFGRAVDRRALMSRTNDQPRSAVSSRNRQGPSPHPPSPLESPDKRRYHLPSPQLPPKPGPLIPQPPTSPMERGRVRERLPPSPRMKTRPASRSSSGSSASGSRSRSGSYSSSSSFSQSRSGSSASSRSRSGSSSSSSSGSADSEHLYRDLHSPSRQTHTPSPKKRPGGRWPRGGMAVREGRPPHERREMPREGREMTMREGMKEGPREGMREGAREGREMNREGMREREIAREGREMNREGMREREMGREMNREGMREREMGREMNREGMREREMGREMNREGMREREMGREMNREGMREREMGRETNREGMREREMGREMNREGMRERDGEGGQGDKQRGNEGERDDEGGQGDEQRGNERQGNGERGQGDDDEGQRHEGRGKGGEGGDEGAPRGNEGERQSPSPRCPPPRTPARHPLPCTGGGAVGETPRKHSTGAGRPTLAPGPQDGQGPHEAGGQQVQHQADPAEQRQERGAAASPVKRRATDQGQAPPAKRAAPPTSVSTAAPSARPGAEKVGKPGAKPDQPAAAGKTAAAPASRPAPAARLPSAPTGAGLAPIPASVPASVPAAPADSVGPTAPAPSAAPKKRSMSSRREELLKQLKAVEDAIARKKSKM